MFRVGLFKPYVKVFDCSFYVFVAGVLACIGSRKTFYISYAVSQFSLDWRIRLSSVSSRRCDCRHVVGIRGWGPELILVIERAEGLLFKLTLLAR